MSVDLSAGLSIQQGILGGSIGGDGLLDLSLSIPVHPALSVGGSVFIDLNNGGSVVGGSFDISILKFIKIEIGRKGCTEYIKISIGISPPKNNDTGNNKGHNRGNRGNSRNNGKNNHGGRTNRNNRNNHKPPIRHGEQTRIQDPNTRLQNDDGNQNNTRIQDGNTRLQDRENDLNDTRKLQDSPQDRQRNLQDNLQDRNRNLQDTVQDRIRDGIRE